MWNRNRFDSNYNSTRLILSVFFFVACSVLSSCTDKISYTNAPYGPLSKPSITFLKGDPSPSSAREGDQVTFGVVGLSKDTSQSLFYINQVPAKLVSIQDSALTLIVPTGCTSGSLQILTKGGEYYLGPILKIIGNVDVDPVFAVGSGTSDAINDALIATDNNYIMVGSFVSYNGYPANKTTFINRIAKIDSKNGNFLGGFDSRSGASGTIGSIAYINSGEYIVGGSFGSFSQKKEATNIARIGIDGSLDTTTISLASTNIASPDSKDTSLPTFNAVLTGGWGGVVKVFQDPNKDAVIAIGNFGIYQTFDYLYATIDVVPYFSTIMSQFIRLNFDGSMDSSFNYNYNSKQSYTGVNGNVQDAIQLSSGKIVFTGSFSSFNGESVGNIAALNITTGGIDQSFNNGGTGADGGISRITYNKITHKIFIVGTFKNYNGVARNGVAMLNEDGSLDDSFNLQNMLGGYVNYAGQLNNGLIIVSGTFSKYNGIVRQGFMILEPDGSLAGSDPNKHKGYNNTGAFSGKINKIIEATTPQNYPAVTLFGEFSMFDNGQYNNIVRIRFLQ